MFGRRNCMPHSPFGHSRCAISRPISLSFPPSVDGTQWIPAKGSCQWHDVLPCRLQSDGGPSVNASSVPNGILTPNPRAPELQHSVGSPHVVDRHRHRKWRTHESLRDSVRPAAGVTALVRESLALARHGTPCRSLRFLRSGVRPVTANRACRVEAAPIRSSISVTPYC